jgi:hypothetical protein
MLRKQLRFKVLEETVLRKIGGEDKMGLETIA